MFGLGVPELRGQLRGCVYEWVRKGLGAYHEVGAGGEDDAVGEAAKM